MNHKQIDRMITKHQEAVRKQRDLLDDNIDHLQALRESCDRAWDSLQDARDALSEMV